MREGPPHTPAALPRKEAATSSGARGVEPAYLVMVRTAEGPAPQRRVNGQDRVYDGREGSA